VTPVKGSDRRAVVATKESVDAPWSPRAVRRFLITCAIVAAILLAPWPRWGRVFVGAFAGYANVVVGFFAIGGANEPGFSAPSADDRLRPEIGEWTVLLVPSGGDNGEAIPLDTRILGYTPFAIFAALVTATPVSRRRKLKLVAGGGAMLLARLAIAIVLPVGRSLGPAGPSWAYGPIADTIWFAFITPPATSYVAAALAWWLALALTTRSGQPPAKGDRRKAARLKRQLRHD
jgi:hypothetical protein